MRFLLTLLMLLLAWAPGPGTPVAHAAAWLEDFRTDPGARGWSVHGDEGLMAWNAAHGRMEVTWDSTRTNTFFYRVLPTILTRADSFLYRASLYLEEIRTANPATTFQIAFGLLQARAAFRTNLYRGSGIHPSTGPLNLVEFNYFPASQNIAPTFSAVTVGTNNTRWGMVNLFPLELTPGSRFDISVRFQAADQRLDLEVIRDGAPWGSGSTRLGATAADFRVDAFSITSYSGAGQPAGYGGQVFARGWVDDVMLEFPDPPAPRLTAHRVAGDPGLHLTVERVATWTPRLEASTPSTGWRPVDLDPVLSPDGRDWIYSVPDRPATSQFFRLGLERP